MKKITEDVQAVVDHLKEKLGATWQEACVVRPQASSKLVNPPRAVRPWVSRNNVVTESNGRKFDRWIRTHLDTKVTWM